MISKIAVRTFLAAGVALLATHASATTVAPGSGHPEGDHPWSATNNNSTLTKVVDNKVCGNGVWITPLAVPTSTMNRNTTITQVRTRSGDFSDTAQGWSFNPDGSVFSGIAETSETRIGVLTVPPGGTAFVKNILSAINQCPDGPCRGRPTSCVSAITFN